MLTDHNMADRRTRHNQRWVSALGPECNIRNSTSGDRFQICDCTKFFHPVSDIEALTQKIETLFLPRNVLIFTILPFFKTLGWSGVPDFLSGWAEALSWDAKAPSGHLSLIPIAFYPGGTKSVFMGTRPFASLRFSPPPEWATLGRSRSGRITGSSVSDVTCFRQGIYSRRKSLNQNISKPNTT